MNTELRDQLASLHTELARTNAVDAPSRELLMALLTDITRLLGPEGETVEDQSVGDRLKELAVDFEADHPSLSAAMRRVVDTLGKAGI